MYIISGRIQLQRLRKMSEKVKEGLKPQWSDTAYYTSGIVELLSIARVTWGRIAFHMVKLLPLLITNLTLSFSPHFLYSKSPTLHQKILIIESNIY